MQRYLEARLRADLRHKVVMLTGARQVGKTTLGRQLMEHFDRAQYLNWDVPADRAVLLRRSWHPHAGLLVFDEVHKMPNWKRWLKGVADMRPAAQAVLLTGSARMETFRQGGESLAGRYLALRLHPISVRESCEQQGTTAAAALARLLQRGGFPEPFLASTEIDADRWRRQYATDLVREDVAEFSRIGELNAMRVFFEMLRERVGSPLSLASMARDLAVSPTTLKRYLDILQALYIVFLVPPWHHNIARALLKSPKVYFFDTGLVKGDEGVRFENAVAGMLLKSAQWAQDAQGSDTALHYVRTKDGAEVDFLLAEGTLPRQLIECKLSDSEPQRALQRFAAQFPSAQALQLVRDLRQDEQRGAVQVLEAAPWLAQLAV